MREAYRKTLLEDGWLDDEQAAKAVALFQRVLSCEGLQDSHFKSTELAREINEYLCSLSANPSATKGKGVTPASDNAKPPTLWDDFHGIKHRLVYNKDTKRIDKVRQFDGLVIESFDPPIECEFYRAEKR